MKKIIMLLIVLFVFTFIALNGNQAHAADKLISLSGGGYNMYFNEIDPMTDTIVDTQYHRKRGAYRMTLSPDNELIYIAHRFSSISLRVFDAETYQYVGSRSFEWFDSGHDVEITPDGRFALVALIKGDLDNRKDYSSIEVLELPSLNTVKSLALNEKNSAAPQLSMHPSGRFTYAWTYRYRYDEPEVTVTVLDIETLEFTGSFTLPGKGAIDVVFSPDGAVAYVLIREREMYTRTIYAVDAYTGEMLDSMYIGLDARSMTVDKDGAVYIGTGPGPYIWPPVPGVERQGPHILRINGGDFAQTEMIPLTGDLSRGIYTTIDDITVSPTGDKVYMVAGVEVFVLDTETLIITEISSDPIFAVTSDFLWIPDNTAPTANAGADQTSECAGAIGSSITLDGSGSTDPDSDALTYTWSGAFGTTTGASANVILPRGANTVTLTVDDGNGGTGTDTVVITVEDTTSPVVTYSLSGNELQTGLYLGDVLLEVTATDTCSGVQEVRYVLDSSQVYVNGGYAQIIITAGGYHSALYDAEDNAGNFSTTEGLSLNLFEANASGINGLIEYFIAQGLIEIQMETSLMKQAAAGNYEAFINHIEAQSGKKIDPAVAQILIQAARLMMNN